MEERRARSAAPHRRRRDSPHPVYPREVSPVVGNGVVLRIQGFHVRSRGTEANARVRIAAGDLGWADIVFVMEPRHRERIRQKLRRELEGKRIVCLHIPDEYDYMDPALVELLKERLRPHITVPLWYEDANQHD